MGKSPMSRHVRLPEGNSDICIYVLFIYILDIVGMELLRIEHV